MSPWVTKRTAITIAVVLSIAALPARCAQVDRSTADKAALVELERYSTREHLDLSRFSATQATEGDEGWLHTYKYSGEPTHEVSILVHRDGRTELGRMLDDGAR